MGKRLLALLISISFSLQTCFGAMVTVIERDISYSFTKEAGNRVTLDKKTDEITGWNVKSGDVVLDENDSFVMPDKNVEIEAIMAEKEEYMLTVETPFFTKSGMQKSGEVAVVEAVISNTDYVFKNWSATGISLSSSQAVSPVLTFTMPNNMVNLVAEFEYNSYTLTVNPEGATYEGGSGDTKAIVAPSQLGYTLTYNYNDGVTSDVRIDVNKVFDSWTLSGAGNISSSTEDAIVYTYGSGNGTLTANYSTSSVILPSPVKDGYTFAGWYTSPTGGTKIGDGGANYTPSASITLYAQWAVDSSVLTVNPGGATYTQSYNTTKSVVAPTQTPYTVTFNYNGNGMPNSSLSAQINFNSWKLTGGGSISSTTTSPTTYTYGKTNGTLTAQYNVASVILPSPTRAGYNFTGWYTATTGGTKVGDAGDSYKPETNITLYAQWQTNDYTLQVLPGNNEYTGEYGNTVSVTAPEQTGYTVVYNFNGSSESSRNVVSEKTFSSWSLVGEGSLSDSTANPTTYTYGAGDAILTANYTNGSITLPSPTREGHAFNGWYTASSGGTKVGNGGENYTPTSNTTLYAQWVAGSYEVRVTSSPVAGGTISGAGAKQYGASVTLTATANPGYTFSSWSVTSGGVSLSSTTSETTSFTMPENDVNITATFTINSYTLTVNPGSTVLGAYNSTISVTAPEQSGYTITYNYNGNGQSNTTATVSKTFKNWTLSGAGSISSLSANPTSYTFGAGDATLTASYVNGSAVLPAPTRTGYVFNGWYTASTGGTSIGNGGERYTPTSDITLYAQWSTVSYIVSISNSPTAGGSVTGAGAKAYGATVQLVAAANSGYTFDSWTVVSGGVTLSSSASTTSFTMPSNDVSIRANYNVNNYTLTVNPGGTTYSGGYGTSKAVTAPDTLYTVTYNYNGSGQTENNVSVLRSFTNWTLTGSGSIDSTTAKSVTYTYGIGNGTLTASYGNGTVVLPNPTREGYTFNGWYTASSGGTEVGAGGAGYTVNGDITLYAQWGINSSSVTVNPGGLTYTGDYGTTKSITAPTDSYTVTYNYNGNGVSNSQVSAPKTFSNWILSGSGSISSTTANPTTYTYGTGNGTLTAIYGTGTVTLPETTRSGYTFSGWYTASSGGTKVGDAGANYEVNSNITLYAQWQNAGYTVSVTSSPTAGGTVTGAGTKIFGNTVELTASPNAGYTFSSWTVVSGGVTLLSTTSTTSFTMPSNNVSITANFVEKDYTLTVMPGNTTYTQKYNTTKEITAPTQQNTVTYNYNMSGLTNSTETVEKQFASWTLSGGGSISSTTANPTTYTYGTSNGTLTANYTNNTVTLPTATKAGYVFNGWFTSQNGGTAVGSAGDSYEVTGNVTLYAQWSTVGYMVSAECVPTIGGSVSGAGNKTYGSTVTLTASPNTGYTFNGWTVVSGGITLSNSSSTSISFTMPSNDVSLNANFVVNSYTLTVYPGGNQYSQNYNTTKSITAPAQSYTVTYNYNYTGSTNTTATANGTFSNWTLSGGGSISSTTESSTTYTYGTTDGILTANYTVNSVILPAPTRDYYTFNGWYTASSGGTKVGDGGSSYTPTSSTTLYAQWSERIETWQLKSGTWNVHSSIGCNSSIGTITGVTTLTLKIVGKNNSGWLIGQVLTSTREKTSRSNAVVGNYVQSFNNPEKTKYWTQITENSSSE